MLEVGFFGLAIGWLWYLLGRAGQTRQGALAARHQSPQLKQALVYADRLYTEKRYNAAERGYAAVLKLDHKSLLAYNRLGIIYSAQKNLKEAIACFETTTRLVPSATTFCNLGLAYYENRNYMKAIATIQKSIMFEPSAQRYIALAKAYDKIADNRGKLEALEAAVQLEPSRPVLMLLRDSYRQAGRRQQLAAVTEQLRALGQRA